MSIPSYDAGGVLPPFLGTSPGSAASQSPYEASPEELVLRFGTSAYRNRLLRGLLELRKDFRGMGIVSGYQWIDGSFVEDKERTTGAPPNDIDVVSLIERPLVATDDASWQLLITPHLPTIFNPAHCKARYSCDAYAIDLGAPPLGIAAQCAYWFGLFSHQRNTYRWKGIVGCPMGSDPMDDTASRELTRRGF